jgi:hypothetical protein
MEVLVLLSKCSPPSQKIDQFNQQIMKEILSGERNNKRDRTQEFFAKFSTLSLAVLFQRNVTVGHVHGRF